MLSELASGGVGCELGEHADTQALPALDYREEFLQTAIVQETDTFGESTVLVGQD